MSLRPALLLALLLTACAPAGDEAYDCNCVEAPTDESSIAMTGFPMAAILAEGGTRVDEATDVTWYEYDPAVATPEMIAASPGNTCGYYDRPVVSTRIADSYPGAGIEQTPGSKYLIVTCGPVNP